MQGFYVPLAVRISSSPLPFRKSPWELSHGLFLFPPFLTSPAPPRPYAAEWGRKNITVNSISPVFMMTAVNREQWKDKPGIEAKIASGNPQGRNCSPELLSGLVTFLLSESASYVNGQNIGCDGGAKHGEISDSFPPEGVGTLQGHQKR